MSSEIDTNMLWEKTGSGSGDQSVRNPNPCNFRSCRTPHTHLSRLLSQKRVARAGVRAAAAEFEYWPLFHGLLISSGFQAAGGSSGRSFQGAVAPVPGRGLQEIACGATQAEVLLGSGPELPRSRGPAVLGANAGAAARSLWRLSSLGRGSSPFSSLAGSDFLAARRPGPVLEAPRERSPKVLGPSEDFFLWTIRRTDGEGKAAGIED